MFDGRWLFRRPDGIGSRLRLARAQDPKCWLRWFGKEAKVGQEVDCNNR
jgi:hypothetical protein